LFLGSAESNIQDFLLWSEYLAIVVPDATYYATGFWKRQLRTCGSCFRGAAVPAQRQESAHKRRWWPTANRQRIKRSEHGCSIFTR
jgi:hypothetical protein